MAIKRTIKGETMAEPKKAKVEIPPEYWWVSYFREDIQEIRGDIKRLDDKTEANINKLEGKIEAFRKEFKEDIGSLRTEFKEDINRLDRKIEALRTEFKEDINRLDGKLDNLAVSLRKEMAELRRSLITWLFAGIGFLAVLITILKFVG